MELFRIHVPTYIHIGELASHAQILSLKHNKLFCPNKIVGADKPNKEDIQSPSQKRKEGTRDFFTRQGFVPGNREKVFVDAIVKQIVKRELFLNSLVLEGLLYFYSTVNI